jgi:hypothetical protein
MPGVSDGLETMKTAISKEGEIIAAGEAAPEAAVCPYCGSPVTLRRRRAMSGDVTYFWRHTIGQYSQCQGRSGPVSKRRNRESGNV